MGEDSAPVPRANAGRGNCFRPHRDASAFGKSLLGRCDLAAPRGRL